MRKRLIIVVLPLLLILFSLPTRAVERRVVIFIADGVDLLEFENLDTPYFKQAISDGAIALLTTKTAGSLNARNAYLTLGSGQRARTASSGYLSFNLSEKHQQRLALDIFQQRTTTEVKQGMVNLEFPFLASYNQQSQYQAEIGYLGAKIKEHGLKVALLGNSDIYQQPRRHAFLIAMDEQGVIKQGDIGQQMYEKSDQYPSSYLTDQSYLKQRLIEAKKESQLIVIDSGDTSRLEAVRGLISAEKYQKSRDEAVKRVDNLLGMTYNELDLNQDYLLILSPLPGQNSFARGNRLGFLTVVGPQMEGFLSSPSTKREGLVNNTDFACGIISLLTEPKSSILMANGLKTENDLSQLIRLKSLINTTFSWRPSLIKGFIVLQIFVLVLAYIYFKRPKSELKRVIEYLTLALLWLPTLFLLSKFFVVYTLSSYVIILLVSTLILAKLSLKFKVRVFSLFFPVLTLALLLTLDLLFALNLINSSILGYSPVIAARFYGIGNEYMGFLVATWVLALFLPCQLLLKKDIIKKDCLLYLYLVLFFMGAITMVHPEYGANFGGLLTWVFISGLIIYKLGDYRLSFKELFKFIFIIVIATGLILNIIAGNSSNSHISDSFLLLKRGNWSELLLIIYRKININLRLFRWTIWTRVLLAFILFLLVILQGSKAKIISLKSSYPIVIEAIYALLLGSVFTALVNDSGVVAAATLLFYPVFTLLYLVLDLK